MSAKNGHINLSWQALALVAAIIITITGGAIQLGTVQTHVVINTARIDKVEDQEHRIIEEVTTLKAQRDAIIGRLDAILDRLKTLETKR